MATNDEPESRIRHLEMIQAVISRLANNSSSTKGWAIVLMSGLFAFAAKDANSQYVIVALIPVLGFWLLDAYYLHQERLFRDLYEHVRTHEEWPNLSMSTKGIPSTSSWLSAIVSKTLMVFYAPLLAIDLTVLALLFR